MKQIRVLRVVQEGRINAYAIFEKQNDEWVMTDCAPILRKTLAGPVSKMGKKIHARGWTYSWAACVLEDDKLDKIRKEVYE